MKGNDVIYVLTTTSGVKCSAGTQITMSNTHVTRYNVKHTRHAIQCQKFILAVVGRKSLVIVDGLPERTNPGIFKRSLKDKAVAYDKLNKVIHYNKRFKTILRKSSEKCILKR